MSFFAWGLRSDQIFVGLLLSALFAIAWLTAGEWRALGTRRLVWGVSLAALAALALRLFLVSPAIVHGDWQGTLIVQGVLGFPTPSGRAPGTYGANYGQGSFVVLGLLTSLFGKSPQAVLQWNVVFSALTTFPLAFVAARWAGRSSAGLYAAAAWATSPLVARLAHSEDAHVIGLFFAFVAFAFAEFTGVSKRPRLAFAGAIVAALLAAWTRETYYAISPIVLLLVLERRIREHPGTSWFAPIGKLGWALAAGIPSVFIGVRFISSLRQSNIYGMVVGAFIAEPRILFEMALDHPVLDIARLGPLVTFFGVGGLVVLALKSKVRVSALGGFTLMFAMTVGAGLPYLGMSWSFRLPVYAVAIVAAGVGADALVAFVAKRWHHLVSFKARAFTVVSVAVLGLCGSATLENFRPNADFVEYDFLTRVIAGLPRTSMLVTTEDESRYPVEAVAAAYGLRTIMLCDLPTSPDSDAWFVPVGLSAHAYTLSEIVGLNEKGPSGMMPESVRGLIVSLNDRRMGYGAKLIKERPIGMRPEFRKLLTRSTMVTESGPTVRVQDALPFAVFSEHQFELGLYRWSE